jgi:hypothetical protein
MDYLKKTDKVYFVSLFTGYIYEYDSWEEIIGLGGLKKIFSDNEYKFLYNYNACVETINSIKSQIDSQKNQMIENKQIFIFSKNTSMDIPSALLYIKPFEKAINLFHKNLNIN